MLALLSDKILEKVGVVVAPELVARTWRKDIHLFIYHFSDFLILGLSYISP